MIGMDSRWRGNGGGLDCGLRSDIRMAASV